MSKLYKSANMGLMAQRETGSDQCINPEFQMTWRTGTEQSIQSLKVREGVANHTIGVPERVMTTAPLDTEFRKELRELCTVIYDATLNSSYRRPEESSNGHSHEVTMGERQIHVDPSAPHVPAVITRAIAFGEEVIRSLPVRK